MKTIIFEGIATSGKTSVEKNLVELLKSKNISHCLIDEGVTLMPVLKNTNLEKSLEILKQSIDLAFKQNKEVYIFDRLHTTHALRTETELREFKEIEDELLKHNPIIIFLKVSESKIPERVLWALNNRPANWVKHARTYGSDEQIIQHYIDQQNELEQAIKSSTLPYTIIDTSQMGFDEIAERIYTEF